MNNLQRYCHAFFLAIMLTVMTNYLLACTDSEIQTNYYPLYADALNDGAVERGWIPRSFPSSIFDIKEQHDLDTNQLWIRFRISQEDKNNLFNKMRKLNDDEILSLEVINPKVDDWWFDGLAGQELKKEGEIIADVYVGTCESKSVYKKSYLTADRESDYIYYWCGP